MSDSTEYETIALVGNPNTGKTTLFNALTGENQKVGNYSGVTVTKKTGTFRTPHGRKVNIADLPGCYTLSPESPDEKVTSDVLLGAQEGEAVPDLIVNVVDASALERHLQLTLHLIELDIPVVIALNMVDVAEKKGIRLDPTIISEELGVPVVPIQANNNKGLIELKQALRLPLPNLAQPSWLDTETDLIQQDKQRTEKIKTVCQLAARRETEDTLTTTDKLDRWFLHPFTGWISFIGIMLAVFYTIFTLSEYPMNWVESFFDVISDWVGGIMPAGDLRDLMTSGIIEGLKGTVIFLPQIIMLFFFIGLMESSGYMSRAAYLMDGIMSRAGLSGRAFLPLLSSHACAIPGIMAARTINSARERLITILIAPWMSCSARIPVYTTIVALLLPDTSAWTKAGIMIAIYATGIITALIASKILSKKLREDQTESHFMLELPPFRKPQIDYLFRHIAGRAYSFLKRAGTVILGISILLWALQTYPKPAEGSPAADDSALALEQSYMGQIGKGIEPVMEPLGYDWRTGTAVLTSFAAREVFISSLAITFSIEEEDEEIMDQKLREKMATATWPKRLNKRLNDSENTKEGQKLYTPLTLLSLLVFFIYALQCFPTTVVVMRETSSWKWATGQLVGMSGFAYVAALLVYQVGLMLGYS